MATSPGRPARRAHDQRLREPSPRSQRYEARDPSGKSRIAVLGFGEVGRPRSGCGKRTVQRPSRSQSPNSASTLLAGAVDALDRDQPAGTRGTLVDAAPLLPAGTWAGHQRRAMPGSSAAIDAQAGGWPLKRSWRPLAGTRVPTDSRQPRSNRSCPSARPPSACGDIAPSPRAYRTERH